MLRSVSFFSWMLAGIAALSFCGCGAGATKRPPMAKVRGVVTYKGEPVSNATVTFMMEGMPRNGTGQTDADGKFRLTTFDTNDGTFIGTHKVSVVKLPATISGKTASELGPADLEKMSKEGRLNIIVSQDIPKKYADMKTTPLKSTVDAGENDKEFELED